MAQCLEWINVVCVYALTVSFGGDFTVRDMDEKHVPLSARVCAGVSVCEDALSLRLMTVRY